MSRPCTDGDIVHVHTNLRTVIAVLGDPNAVYTPFYYWTHNVHDTVRLYYLFNVARNTGSS